MFSAATIAELSADAARDAARHCRAPFVIFSTATAEKDFRSAPFVGDYVAHGWKPFKLDPLADVPSELLAYAWGELPGPLTFFVDTTGWGAVGERALALSQQKRVAAALAEYAAEARVVVGVALLEVGQFQAVLGVFVKARPTKLHSA